VELGHTGLLHTVGMVLLENQELVALPFIPLANRQSSSVEYAVF
jgi:hypothetical protein